MARSRKGLEALHALASEASTGAVERFYGNVKRGPGYTTLEGVRIGQSVYDEVPGVFHGRHGEPGTFSPLDAWNLAVESGQRPLQIAREAARELYPGLSKEQLDLKARYIEFLANEYSRQSGDVKRLMSGRETQVQSSARRAELSVDTAPLYERFREKLTQRLKKTYILDIRKSAPGQTKGASRAKVFASMDGEEVEAATRDLSGRGKLSEILPGKMRYKPGGGARGRDAGSYLFARTKGGGSAPIKDSKGRVVSGGHGVTSIRVDIEDGREWHEATPEAIAAATNTGKKAAKVVKRIARRAKLNANDYAELNRIMSGDE